MKFNLVDPPYTLEEYYTKYPEGFTIYEALLDWLKQVNDLTDNVNDWNTYLENFVLSFDTHLQSQVQSVIAAWVDDGSIDVIISEALQTQISSVELKIQGLLYNVMSYGAVGDGVTDDTIAIQTTINTAVAQGLNTVFFPKGLYRLTTPLLITSDVVLKGVGASPYTVMGAPHTKGSGSWLYVDHSGVAVSIASGVSLISNCVLDSLGTYRNQPTPTLDPYTPGVFDYDVSINNAHVEMKDMVLLNPTKGVKLNNGVFGRLNITNLKMHPMEVGVHIVESYDVVRLDGIHIWPFWAFDDTVWAWNRANTTGILFERSDNPMLSNIFTFNCLIGLKMTSNDKGATNKLRLVNGDFDLGSFGIIIEGKGVTAQLANITIQGEHTLTTAYNGIAIFGDNSKVDITNIDIKNAIANAVNIAIGTGNRLTLSNLRIAGFNIAEGGYAAINCAVDNSIYITNDMDISDGHTAEVFSGIGLIQAPLKYGLTTATTDSQGFITINHNSNATPNYVDLTVRQTNRIIVVQTDSYTKNTFRLRAFDANGNGIATTEITVEWKVFK